MARKNWRKRLAEGLRGERLPILGIERKIRIMFKSFILLGFIWGFGWCVRIFLHW